MASRYSLLFLCCAFLFIACGDKKETAKNPYQFKDYISYTSSGVISKAKSIDIYLSRDIKDWEEGQLIEEGIVKLSPAVEGEARIVSGRHLVFEPKEFLQPNTEYSVTVHLDRLLNEVDPDLKSYTFQLKTIEPNFDIKLRNLQSYDKQWQYVEGELKSADVISVDEAKQLIEASQDDRDLQFKWYEDAVRANVINFRLDSIQRFDTSSQVKVFWDGEPIGAQNKDEEILEIPGRDNFTVVGINHVKEDQEYLAINFSDPLKDKQNFKGLVKLSVDENPSFAVDGNLLKVYSTATLTGDILVTIAEGIVNQDNYKTKKTLEQHLLIESLKPAVRLLGTGNILPYSDALKFDFEAVNLEKVDVRVIKIFEDNVLQFLQDNEINEAGRINRVGRRIALETITLVPEPKLYSGGWKAYSVDLAPFVKTDPGAIYRVELSFRKSYSLYDCKSDSSDGENESFRESEPTQTPREAQREEDYWNNRLYDYRSYSYNWRERDNPCHDAYYNRDRVMARNVLASNLGITVKEGSDHNYFIVVTNLLTTKPVSGATVRLYNFQQQEIDQLRTADDGTVSYESDTEAYFATVQKNDEVGYIKLNDGNALSLSKYDVSGRRIQKGIKGFIYAERGVWRPGDSIFLNFMLNDKAQTLPNNHPIKLEVTDPRGKVVFQKTTSEHLNRLYSFPFSTATEAQTGIYNARVSVGGATFNKQLRVETVKPNRLKIAMELKDEVVAADEPIEASLKVDWLYGAPARDVRVQVEARLNRATFRPDKFPGFSFNNPTENHYEKEIPIFDANADQEGKATFSKKIEVNKRSPGLLKLNYLVRAYEKGGDFSLNTFSQLLAPHSCLIGLRVPDKDDYGSYPTGVKKVFEVASVSPDGTAIPNRKLKVKLYEINWRWWWDSGRDNLSRYSAGKVHTPYKTFEVETNSNGVGRVEITIPDEERGRYLMMVEDKEGSHAAGETMYFYENWWEDLPAGDKEAASMLVFNTDKDAYEVGEKAKITFPSAKGGSALLTLENGDGVLQHQWVETKGAQTSVTVDIIPEMSPNFFASISFLQPHASVENDLPIRQYGVIPVMVSDPSKKLSPIIEMQESVEPEKEFELVIKEENGKPMTYTIAIVEEGLLDLTNFNTPDPYNHFYSKEALGVRTWDIFDDVIGAQTGQIDQVFAIGGDGGAAAAKNKKANRFKPIVKHIGPFYAGAKESKKHSVVLPNYLGAVRVMIVAGDHTSEAYGNAEKSVKVKKPLMVLSTLPRKLSPTEKVTMPVTVFATESSIKNVTVKTTTSDGLKIIGQAQKTLAFNKIGEQLVDFEFEVTPVTGPAQVRVEVQAGKHKSYHTVDLNVENPNPLTTRVINKVLEPGDQLELDWETFGVTGTNSAIIELSNLPSLDFESRLAYLIRYPHGCVEQTTSSVFPQLFMEDVVDVPLSRKQEIKHNVQQAIRKLDNFQTSSGGLSYWSGGSKANEWGTSYAGHFMLEAQKKGYALPFGFIKNWIAYQRKAARNWRPKDRYANGLQQAYRLYTLALAGKPELGAMNRLRESKSLSNSAKWRLAAAYAISGQSKAAESLINTASLQFDTDYRYHYRTYGSTIRNTAMALETLIILDDKMKAMNMAKSIARDLNSDRWMSTQTTAYGLLAMSKLLITNGGKGMNVTAQDDKETISLVTRKPMISREVQAVQGQNKINLVNNGENVVYVALNNRGQLPLGTELSVERNLRARIRFQDSNGKPIDVSEIQQGMDFSAIVRVYNSSNNRVNDVALTQIFPSGWEIVNTRFTDFGDTVNSEADYTDIRDDRVNFYFDLDRAGNNDSSKTFTIQLNAAYLGKYYLPGLQVEAMYDNDYLSRGKGEWVEVKR